MGEVKRVAAVLRAIGWSRGHLQKQLSSEATILGFIGGTLGVLLTEDGHSRNYNFKIFSSKWTILKSNDPAAFLGSQYAVPLMEANLPLSLDQLF